MIDNGAIGSMMSGSGPTVFGFFSEYKEGLHALKFIKNKFRTKEVYLTTVFNIRQGNRMNEILILTAVVIVICIVLNKISNRLGIPMLLGFIVLGMVFGSDGILKIQFDNFAFADYICSTALIFYNVLWWLLVLTGVRQNL